MNLVVGLLLVWLVREVIVGSGVDDNGLAGRDALRDAGSHLQLEEIVKTRVAEWTIGDKLLLKIGKPITHNQYEGKVKTKWSSTDYKPGQILILQDSNNISTLLQTDCFYMEWKVSKILVTDRLT